MTFSSICAVAAFTRLLNSRATAHGNRTKEAGRSGDPVWIESLIVKTDMTVITEVSVIKRLVGMGSRIKLV